jgi:iron complex transport system substrate-binding protein
VFEVGAEELVARAPDVVVVLYSSGTPEAAEQALRASPAGAALLGVADPEIVPLEFPLTDPPTPLTVTGAERLRAAVAG